FTAPPTNTTATKSSLLGTTSKILPNEKTHSPTMSSGERLAGPSSKVSCFSSRTIRESVPMEAVRWEATRCRILRSGLAISENCARRDLTVPAPAETQASKSIFRVLPRQFLLIKLRRSVQSPRSCLRYGPLLQPRPGLEPMNCSSVLQVAHP